MIKYLPQGEISVTNLADTRSKSTDLAIVFHQDLSELIKTIYETCQNMVKIAQDQNGNILIDEYSMDDITPTIDMKEKLFSKVGAEIMEQLYRFCKDDYSVLYDVKYKDESKVSYFPVDNVSFYETSLLITLDSAIRDMLIYGVLDAWFSIVNSKPLKELSTFEYAKSRDIFLKTLKSLFRKYRFNKVKDYV